MIRNNPLFIQKIMTLVVFSIFFSFLTSLFDVVGMGEEVAPAHIGSTWVKVGIVPLVKVIVPVKLCEPHPPIVVMV